MQNYKAMYKGQWYYEQGTSLYDALKKIAKKLGVKTSDLYGGHRDTKEAYEDMCRSL